MLPSEIDERSSKLLGRLEDRDSPGLLDGLEETMAEGATAAAESAEQEALRSSLRFCVRFNWMEKKGCALPRSRAACPASALAANDSSLVCRGIRPNWLRRKFAPPKCDAFSCCFQFAP